MIGSYTARFDKSGRIKIPEKFRAAIEEQYGKEVFITSLTDQAVQIYPLPVWKDLAGITNEGLFHLKPDVRNFMRRVNLKGSYYEIDSKGRILISQALKEKAKLEEEEMESVAVISVRDSGAGATEDTIQNGRRRGVGLRNVEERLQHYYGDGASIAVSSQPR